MYVTRSSPCWTLLTWKSTVVQPTRDLSRLLWSISVVVRRSSLPQFSAKKATDIFQLGSGKEFDHVFRVNLVMNHPDVRGIQIKEKAEKLTD